MILYPFLFISDCFRPNLLDLNSIRNSSFLMVFLCSSFFLVIYVFLFSGLASEFIRARRLMFACFTYFFIHLLSWPLLFFFWSITGHSLHAIYVCMPLMGVYCLIFGLL